MNNIELAWAAGFFDGEGWSSVYRYSKTKKDGTRPYYVQIGVAQVDVRPLERFVAAVGTGSIRGPYPTSTTPCRHVYISGSGARRVMEILWPYLSEPKREQYLAALERGGLVHEHSDSAPQR